MMGGEEASDRGERYSEEKTKCVLESLIRAGMPSTRTKKEKICAGRDGLSSEKEKKYLTAEEAGNLPGNKKDPYLLSSHTEKEENALGQEKGTYVSVED